MPYVLSLLTLALMIFALVDIITRRDDQVRYLPKMVWLILAILMPVIGSVLWFALGREYGGGIAAPRRRRSDAGVSTRVSPAPVRAADPRTTEQQMADLDREIEEWRLRQEIAKRRQERGEAGTG